MKEIKKLLNPPVGIYPECASSEMEYVHHKDINTMPFVDGSVGGSNVNTIRSLGIKSRETGADIHAIGDAGLAGCSLPENIYQ